MSDLIQKSKYLSLLLRHKPEKIGLTLDENGWAYMKDLVDKGDFDAQELIQIVHEDQKSRYELSTDNERIRAVQGHSASLAVTVEMEKFLPRGDLYHGTKENVRLEIAKKGLLPMNRQHVHLTDDLKTAQETADRRKGKSIILTIDAVFMSAEGHKFYKAKNGVVLTNEVPTKFIKEYK